MDAEGQLYELIYIRHFRLGLEYPWILVSAVGLGTNPLQIPRQLKFLMSLIILGFLTAQGVVALNP